MKTFASINSFCLNDCASCDLKADGGAARSVDGMGRGAIGIGARPPGSPEGSTSSSRVLTEELGKKTKGKEERTYTGD
jgi:hypothetical protein